MSSNKGILMFKGMGINRDSAIKRMANFQILLIKIQFVQTKLKSKPPKLMIRSMRLSRDDHRPIQTTAPRLNLSRAFTPQRT